MTIRIENVYNTQSLNKTEAELKTLAEKHVKSIIKQLTAIDNSISIELETVYQVDWTEQGRGIDWRFKIRIRKEGRKLTTKEIYYISNKTCLRPCYF